MTRYLTRSGALLLPITLAACGLADAEWSDPFTATGELVALSGGNAGPQGACITCHGLSGEGNGAGIPRIAALDRGYLVKQLTDYAEGLRTDTQMAEIARRLDPNSRQAVATYYASLPLPVTPTRLSHRPETLYLRGDPSRGIPACANCHGVFGEGVGFGNPGLGRQPAPYLAEQLRLWRDSRRRNDPEATMLRISRKLAPDEIKSLSVYAGALPAVAPSRESRAAFRVTHRPGPRSDASAQPLRGAE